MTLPAVRPRRWRRPTIAVVVVGVVVIAVVALVAFISSHDYATTPSDDTSASPVDTSAPVSSRATPPVPAGPLAGYDGTYQLTVDNVHISGASGGFVNGRLERSGATVTARYGDPGSDASTTVDLPAGPMVVTCAADLWTCAVQWSGSVAVAIDGSLGHPVLTRPDGSPVGRGACNLPIPSDGTVIPEFGLVDKRPQVNRFRVTVGTASVAAAGCDNAVVVAYDLVAVRSP
jgi:hypothetical protein